MIKAVIFDMDGVIIDSEPLHWDANKQIFAQLGIPIQDVPYSNYIGVSNEDMWQDLKNLFNLSHSIEELVQWQNEETLKYFKETPYKPIDGIVELLIELKNNNFKVGLASSSPEILIEEVLTHLDIKKYFDTYASADYVPRGKPKPDLFLYTAGLLQVKPKECVVIEDSKQGVKAAKAAGMKCIGFANPNSMNQDLSQADIIVKSFKDITIDLIKSLEE
ncbi:MAG TPA: HAD family phosphatase [Defluviitoga sp.]|nr:HAD family phosphatase [Defluviitoga sp.]HOP24792.1 HAD family phosphatase [Defluviitoga sp.]HPZ29361.1 HAD family phosphatase [Defluviitoga sp.]HQD63287.1 HAD family phosphatase [Defluviitoga sp.]